MRKPHFKRKENKSIRTTQQVGELLQSICGEVISEGRDTCRYVLGVWGQRGNNINYGWVKTKSGVKLNFSFTQKRSVIASHSSSTTTSEYFTLRAIGIITTYEVFTIWLLRALYVRRRVLNYFLAHIILINVETTTTRLRVCIRDLSVCPCSFWQLLLPPLYAIVLSSHTWYSKPLNVGGYVIKVIIIQILFSYWAPTIKRLYIS